MTIAIRPLDSSDWDRVVEIYAAGIATGDATFEATVPTWADWNDSHLQEHRLVAIDDSTVVGWAAASPVSDRCAYAGVVENSVYVDPDHRGSGIGRQLLAAFISSTEGAGIWTIQTGIFPENQASLALHEGCGFRRVGVRERLGQLDGRWRDVVLLERRSPLI